MAPSAPSLTAEALESFLSFARLYSPSPFFGTSSALKVFGVVFTVVVVHSRLMKRPAWLSLSFFKEWALWTLSLASGGPTVILALIFYLQGREPPKNGLLIFLLLCSLVAAWAAGLRERNVRLQGRKPRLRVAPGDFGQTHPVWVDKGCRTIPTRAFSALILRVENDPLVPTADSVARQVTARISFCRVDGTKLFDFDGRWSDTIQPSRLPLLEPTIELNTVDIAIGVRRELDLVLKYDAETDCFGVNNKSYRFPWARNPEWELGAGEYLIRVRLRGIGVDQPFLLRFRNPEGTEPLEPISCEEVPIA